LENADRFWHASAGKRAALASKILGGDYLTVDERIEIASWLTYDSEKAKTLFRHEAEQRLSRNS
jgi:hypothetical protein